MVPQHIAIIMDGNGRWARGRGLPRIEGHKAGAASVRAACEECIRQGVTYLTLFSFSTENWKRSADEVGGLMELFRRYLDSELSTLLDNGIRLHAIGDLDRLPYPVRLALNRTIKKTEKNTKLNLVLAVSYGGREEIVDAAQKIAQDVAAGKLRPEDVDADCLRSRMWSSTIPDPDLLIRTSGEVRISNFLLWQLAYTEIVLSDVLWPDFNGNALADCIQKFKMRERRFGLTSEQLQVDSTQALTRKS